MRLGLVPAVAQGCIRTVLSICRDKSQAFEAGAIDDPSREEGIRGGKANDSSRGSFKFRSL
jgi:hypothetical protein